MGGMRVINFSICRSRGSVMPGQLFLLIIALLLPAAALGQQAPGMLTIPLVEQRLAFLRESGTAADSDIVVAYENVKSLLVQMESHDQDTAHYIATMTTAPQKEAQTQARIDALEETAPPEENLEGLDYDELEARLAAVRAQLSEANNSLDDLEARLAARESEAASMRSRQSEISALIETSPNRPLSLDTTAEPSLAEAQRWLATVEYLAVQAEKRAIEARLTSQPVRYSALAVGRAEAALSVKRLSQLSRELEKLLREHVTVAVDAESMGIAAEDPIYALANHLAASDAELREESIEVNDNLADTRRRIEDIDRQSRSIGDRYATARRIVDFAADSEVLGSVLLAHWRELGQYRLVDPLGNLSQQAGETVIRRIELEESLRRLSSATAYINDQLKTQGIEVDAVAENSRNALVKLVQAYRERLRKVIGAKSEYIEALSTLGDRYQSLTRMLTEYESYLKGLILWIPAYPPLWNADTSAVSAELTALGTMVKTTRLSPYPITLLGLLVVALLFSQRHRLGTCEQEMGARIARPRDDAIQHTLVALACVALRAATLPLLLVAVALALSPPGLATAISDTGIALFILQSIQILCAPKGVGPVHFGWSKPVVARIHRELTRLILWWLPLFLVSLLIVRATAETGQTIIARWSLLASLLVPLASLASSLYRVSRNTDRNWLRDISNQVRLLLIAILLTIFVAVSFGHVYSVNIIFYSLVYTVLSAYFLVLVHAILMRWVRVTRRRLRLAQLMDARKEQQSPEDELLGEAITNLGDVSSDTNQLINMGIFAGAATALFYIWSPLLPAFDAFSKVTLWTSATVVDGQAVDNRISLAMLITVILLASLTIYAARKLPALIDLLLRSRTSVTASARYTVSALLNYVILGGGFIAALSSLGLQWSQLQWLVAALGVGIGFGLQEIIANFISGIIILFERPIRVGDVVSTGGSDGVVARIRIRATTIIDWDGKELLVPNKEFITGRLLNWSLSDPKIRTVLPVGIAYGSDVELAIKTLYEIVHAHPRVIDDPEPQIVFESFGDNALMLSARCFLISLENRMGVVTELNREIYKRFAEAGIVIAFPQRDIHFDPDKPIRIDLGSPSGE